MSVTTTTPTAAPGTPPAARTGAASRVYSVLSVILVLLVVVQILVAGSGLFSMAHQLDNNQSYTVDEWNNSAYWGIHFFNAFAIALVMLLMLGTAFIGGMSSQTKRFTGILIGLLVLQGILGFIPWPAPVAALHVLNAFAILGLGGFLLRMNWAFARRNV